MSKGRESREAQAACEQTQPRDSHAPFSREAVKTTKEISPSAQLLHIRDNVCIFSRSIKATVFEIYFWLVKIVLSPSGLSVLDVFLVSVIQ